MSFAHNWKTACCVIPDLNRLCMLKKWEKLMIYKHPYFISDQGQTNMNAVKTLDDAKPRKKYKKKKY